MRNYDNKIINIIEFIIINLYFSNIFEGIQIFIKIFIKIYLIENLKINIFIEINIFTSYKFLLKCVF